MRLVFLLLAVFIGGFVALAVLLDIVPDRRATMAAGDAGSAYHAFALRYRDILAEDGVTLDILETPGSVANLDRLASGEADVALVQGGIAAPDGAPVSALATVFLEPLLVFHRAGLVGADDPVRWAGLRVAGGAEGSGTRYAVRTVLETLGLKTLGLEGADALVPLSGGASASALMAGRIDVAIFVAPVGAGYLAPLYAAPDIVLASIRDVEALRRRLPFVMQADLPPASLDYAGVKPAARVDLAAMVGQLAARDDLHPALVDRFVRAARLIHAERDLLTGEGQFPSVEGGTLPMNKQARTILATPPSRLDSFLPWWMAAQVTKMMLLIVPLILVMLPLLRVLPGIYGWTMRSRVYKHYSDLIEIEKRAEAANGPEERRALVARLDAVQESLTHMRLPEAFRDRAYTMQMHIDMIRTRLTDGGAA